MSVNGTNKQRARRSCVCSVCSKPLSAGAVKVGEVTTLHAHVTKALVHTDKTITTTTTQYQHQLPNKFHLNHEVLDHTVENAVGVTEALLPSISSSSNASLSLPPPPSTPNNQAP